MTVLRVQDGFHGEVVGTVHVDGSLETDDEALRADYEELIERTDDLVAVPYAYPRDDGDVHSMVTLYVRAGDPEFLTAVEEGLGGTWVGRPDGGDLARLDPQEYDGLSLSTVFSAPAASVESAEED